MEKPTDPVRIFRNKKTQNIQFGYSVMRKPTNPVKIFSYKKSNYPARCRYQLWKSRNIRPDICYEKTLSVKVSVMKKNYPARCRNQWWKSRPDTSYESRKYLNYPFTVVVSYVKSNLSCQIFSLILVDVVKMCLNLVACTLHIAHCPKNNLNLLIKTEPVGAGAVQQYMGP